MEQNTYKQEVARYFNGRTPYDDEDEFHHDLAGRLLGYAHLQPGQSVLDIATGSGLIAIEAAKQVGSRGRVLGVDIASGMLTQARARISRLKLFNIELMLADAETLKLPENTFDVILCSSALIYMQDIPAALARWRYFLKPSGWLGFHGFSKDAFVAGVALREAALEYGVKLCFNEATKTEAACRRLLESAGYRQVEIHTEQLGGYISLTQAKAVGWNLDNPFEKPLQALSAEALARLKQDYRAKLEALDSGKGLWNDITTFFAFGRKP
jgi:ubiquinone/menaquinone biosynthesis C-methylase UbiE